ncbi:AGC protein kinase [Puccinia sorghi]|uniref:AGC protein kinase n=1 Tax=Puccinia sorghi TaxID=27349 RepID=A0A0L6UVW3_9BASI|nr:AGC protein kinase [Puccinia sorghi]
MASTTSTLAADVVRAANQKSNAANQMRQSCMERVSGLNERLRQSKPSWPYPNVWEKMAHRPSNFNVSSDVFHPRPRRPSLTPNISGPKFSPASRLVPIDTKVGESRGLEILKSQMYSGLGTPPRLPRAQRASQSLQPASLGPVPMLPRIPLEVPGKSKAAVSIKDFDMLKFGQV